MLPPELWSLILLFLSPVCEGVARSVCKSWRDMLPARPEVMREATVLLEDEGHKACAKWAMARGCANPALLRCVAGDLPAAVIDNGSCNVSAGFSGDDAPRQVFRSMTGRPLKSLGVVSGGEASRKDSYVGDEAQKNRDFLALTYPIKHSRVQDWDAMEKVWDYTYSNVLKKTPEEQPVILTDAILNPFSNREKMAQLMFETFQVPGLSIAHQPWLAHYGTGSGCVAMVVCHGHGCVQVMPIYEGYILRPYMTRVDHLGGCNVTEYLKVLLTERGHDLSTAAEHEIVRDMAERLGYVADNFAIEMEKASRSSALEKSYVLPDGQVVTIGNERFRCTEALFRPELIGVEGPGIHELIYNTIMKCDIDLRKDYFGSILQAGGCPLFPGYTERLQKELVALAPATIRVVNRGWDPRNAVWLGGSMMGSLSIMGKSWISATEYDECGPSIGLKYWIA